MWEGDKREPKPFYNVATGPGGFVFGLLFSTQQLNHRL
jgi:hypothetical protein